MNSQRIAIITDSGTDTAECLIREHDVRVVPLRIIYSDGTTYQSGVDITPSEVVARFAQEIPTTSLPSPEQIRATLEQARADGYERAVIITISSGLSATNQTAQLVAAQMEGFPTIVVDTKSIGMVGGMVVARAVEMVAAGVPFEELAGRLERSSRDSDIYFGVKSLEYLYKGGRIGGHIYRIGSVLNIKPILTCNDEGRYVMARKARGWDRALDAMVGLAVRSAGRFERVRLSVCCSDATNVHMRQLADRLHAEVPSTIVSMLESDISADLLVHTGPDLVGIGIQRAE